MMRDETMNKHAYMIVANANLKVLEICLQLLDDARNDIYVLFDRKSKIQSEYKEKLGGFLHYSKIVFCNDFVINWGGEFADCSGAGALIGGSSV